MVSEGFGTRLRELRKQAGFSQRELAERIGVDFTYLSKIENGVMPPPSEKVILRLAEVLNANPDELLARAQKIPPDIIRMLQNPETLQFLRARQNQKRIRPLGNIRIPGIKKFKSLTRVALAVTLVASIGVSLWFASPLKALDISFPTPPTSGTIGSSHSFSVKVTLNDAELLPVQGIELEIYNVANSATYKARVEDLPLTAVTKSYSGSQTGGGAASVTATVSNWGWGYGYGYVAWEGTPQHFGYGYGYGAGTASITYAVTWTSPSGWPTGEYKVKTTINAGSKTFTKTSSAFTLSSAPVGELIPTPPPVSIVVQEGVAVVSTVVSNEGIFTRDVIIQSEDAKVSLDIDRNTTGKTKEGNILTTITTTTVAEPPAPPELANIIGLAYDFGPNGATFDPPITITFTYNPADIPAGTAETDLVVAWWNNETGEWVILDGATVDPINNTISAATNHFTQFAVITRPPAAPAAFSTGGLTISPTAVSIGQTVTIGAVVTNTGELSGDYKVTLKINNVVVATKTITLDGGISQRVTFTTTQDVAGTYLVDIDGETAIFSVNAVTVLPKPAAFTSSNLAILPKTVDVGKAATISAVVTNTGELSGDYKVTLKINNVVVTTKTITLDSGTSQTVSFTTTQEVAGAYAVSIDGLSGTLTVEAPQTSPIPVAPPVNWWLIGSIIAVVIAIAAVVVWLVVLRPRTSE